MGLFKKATKEAAKLRLAIAGPSGSGKTYSALAIAKALGGPVALVDTEHGSASKYADIFDFDVAEMHAPFHPDKYIAAIKEAASAGYKVIILDSLTHAWNGDGGLLDLVEEAAKRMKSSNTFAAWKDVTPIQNRFIEAIVSANIHIIGTMRSKQEYVQEKNDKGYTVVRKVGMAPVQRDGFEYEFDVFFDMDSDNNAVVSKTRCPDLAGKVIAKPGAQVGKILSDWLGNGAPTRAEIVDMLTEPQVQDTDTNGDVLFATEPKETPPHRRLWGIGKSVFGDDWDMARAWLITKWTTHHTPDDARDSASDLSDDEKTMLGDYLNEQAGKLQKVWPNQKALILQRTNGARANETVTSGK